MRTIQYQEIINNIKEMCIEANHFLSEDMKKAFETAKKEEESPLGKQILSQLEENLAIAGEEMIPICQDTGMAVIFVKIGQDVHIEGGNITEAINEGVRQGYTEGFLRKSVVNDPILRENTKDNTPAVIHYDIVAGDKVEITVAPKGFGSENMSRVFMLKPADGIEGVKQAVLTAVKDAGPNACPPMVVGVGIGGTFEKCAILAKKALNAYKTNKEKTEKENFEKAKKIEEERKNSIDADFVLELGKGYYRQGNIITGTRKEVLNRALFMNTSTKFFQILYPDYPGGTQYVGIDVKMTEPLPYKALLKYEKSENIHEVENISRNSVEYKHGVLETGLNTSSSNESREKSVNLDSIKIIIYLKSKEHSVVVFTLKNEQDALRLQVKLEEILKESNKTTN